LERKPLKRLLVTFFAVILCSHLAYGQARPTATRTGDLQIGAAFAYNYPDYTEHKFQGYTIYGDLDFGEHFGIEGEFRQTNDHTERIGGGGSVPQYQRNIEGGLRYHRDYGRFYPYAKFMYGYGGIEYPPYPPPASQAISAGTGSYQFVAPGGGLDYRVAAHVTARIGMEYQLWFAQEDKGLGIDFNQGNKGGIPVGLTPIIYEGGIAYRFGSGVYKPNGRRNHGGY
jgi:hypothetical protein